MVNGQKILPWQLATDILEFTPWSMVKMDILSSISWFNFRLTILTTRNLDFDISHGQDPDYLTTDILIFGSWSQNDHGL